MSYEFHVVVDITASTPQEASGKLSEAVGRMHADGVTVLYVETQEDVDDARDKARMFG